MHHPSTQNIGTTPDLQDTRTAFAARSDRELWQAAWLFRIIGTPWLSAVGVACTKVALALHLPIKGLIKATIFKQFCGGETIKESLGTAAKLKASGIGKSLNWSDSLSLSPAVNGGGNDAGVGRLWARSRIASLEDSLRQGADESKVREQVIDVALRHHLVSSYTSLVAVDRTPVRPESEDMASVRFQNATPDGQLAFAHGGTGARSRLSLAICLLLLGLAVAKARRLPGLA